MATLGQTQYYKTTTNGIDSYQAMPFGGNDPYGYTPITQDQYVQGLQGKITSAQQIIQQQSQPGYTGANYTQNDITNFQKQISDAQSGTGIHVAGYVDPGFAKFQANAPTPSEQYYTPEYRATLAPSEQARLNQLYGQSNPITPLASGQQEVKVGNAYTTIPSGSAGAANINNPAPNQPTGVTDTTNSITLDQANGSYAFQGKSYNSLSAAQAAAGRAGVTAGYTPPPSAPTTAGGAGPQRSTYVAGPAGDFQYQQALARYQAAQKPPTQGSTTAATNAAVNAAGNAALAGATSAASAPPGAATSSTNSQIDSLLSSAESAQVPVAPNTVALTSQLQTQYNTAGITSNINNIDAQIQQISDGLKASSDAEQNKAVPLGVISGRISTEEQQANARINQLNEQKGVLVNQLTAANTAISTVMAATQQDFANAEAAYSAQVSKSVDLANLLRGIKSDQQTVADAAQTHAAATFTTIANAITSGAVDYNSIDPATKAQYATIEAQAGIPPGTLAAYAAKPSAQWSMSTVLPGVDANGNQTAQVVEQNKQTGALRLTTLTSTSQPKPSSADSQKGTFVDDSGNEIAWSIDANGKKTTTVVGKTTTKVDPAQNTYDKLRVSIAETLSKTDAYGDPVAGAQEAATRLIKATYPGASDDQVQQILASF